MADGVAVAAPALDRADAAADAAVRWRIGAAFIDNIIVYGGYLLLRPSVRSLRLGPVSDVCAGFLGGITGGLAGFPGAFVTVWCRRANASV